LDEEQKENISISLTNGLVSRYREYNSRTEEWIFYSRQVCEDLRKRNPLPISMTNRNYELTGQGIGEMFRRIRSDFFYYCFAKQWWIICTQIYRYLFNVGPGTHSHRVYLLQSLFVVLREYLLQQFL